VRVAPAAPPVVPPAPGVDVRAPTVTVDVPPAMREPAAPVPPPAPPLRVHLTVDFDDEAAQLAVEGTGKPIRLALAGGQWRVADGET
jgi:hypothetical protein